MIKTYKFLPKISSIPLPTGVIQNINGYVQLEEEFAKQFLGKYITEIKGESVVEVTGNIKKGTDGEKKEEVTAGSTINKSKRSKKGKKSNK